MEAVGVARWREPRGPLAREWGGRLQHLDERTVSLKSAYPCTACLQPTIAYSTVLHMVICERCSAMLYRCDVPDTVQSTDDE